MKTNYLYEGFRDPPQKITGDSYRALFGLQDKYYGRVPKKNKKWRLSKETICLVFRALKRHYELYGETPVTHSALCAPTNLSAPTIRRCAKFLESKNKIKIFYPRKNRHLGLIYKIIEGNCDDL